MTATRLSPPTVPGYTWRALCLDDAPALHQLELDCEPADGGTDLSTVEQYREKLQGAGQRLTTDTLCAADSAGRLAASAWVTCDVHLRHEYRFFLDGRVHSEYRGRGLGSFVLQWMETRARRILTAQKEDRPSVLRLDFYDRSDDALDLFERHGFRFAFAEDEMMRDLSLPMPAVQLPDGMSLVTWGSQRASLFFNVYQDAFREGPGFPHWSEEVWVHNLTGGASFRPELSLLMLQGAEPVGFAACHVETGGAQDPAEVGWIAELGVRPAWRRRGLGSAVLNEVMRRFQAEGLLWAALAVNIDNDSALGLYQRLGFERWKRRTSYQKAVGSHPLRDGESP